MNKRSIHSGLTLAEIIVVIAVMAILMSVAVPAVKAIMKSFDEGTGVRQLINAAFSSARAIAIREQAYAGVRFQQDRDGNTYMIFVINDSDPPPDGTDLVNGFRAVEGRKPMKLPDDVGVIPNTINSDVQLWGTVNWNDSTTFSIVFSPSGKLVTHFVRVRNKDGYTEAKLDPISNDVIFNTMVVVDGKAAMFYQDDYYKSDPQGYPNLGLGQELSVTGFFLYSKKDVPVNSDTLWSGYFSKRTADNISPYTGSLIMDYREQN